MTATQAKTIRNCLPTGELHGIRVTDLTTRIVPAVAIPPSDLATVNRNQRGQDSLFS